MISSHHHHHHPLCLLPMLFILIISQQTSTAQTHTNISLGSSLSTPTTKTTPSWTSPSGDFAFGFLPFPNNTTLFLLAIYINSIPEKTIVWSANGDNPVLAGSNVTLTGNGQLVLSDPNGRQLWTSKTSGGGVTHAAMLDNGNFVLATVNSSNNAWESFSLPTDTILPSQELGLGSALLAHITEMNYSSGRFTLQVQTDGNLVLNYIDQITKNNYGSYWASNTVGSGVKLVFDVSGSVYFALKNNTVFNVTGSGASAKDYHQRMTLDPDGVFRQYIYPKTNMSTRNNTWSLMGYVASDICTASIANFGSGVCGFNSYCKPDTSQNTCECPKGYSFFDEDLKYKGCKPDLTAQSCDIDDSGMYQLEEMLDVNWPNGDYEHYNPISEDQCRSLCLEDCFCAVAIFGQSGCWKKKLPLSNGRVLIGQGKALIKIARMPRRDMNILEVNLQSFSYKELEETTDKFREELGRGAFGIVYKGVLNSSPAIHVAVKKLDKMAEGAERERRLDALVNSDEEVMSDTRRLERFLKVALWCIQEDPSLRPPMKKVSQMLEGAVEVAVPPDPSSFISSIN
ncbi:G-type lectin S-receptor-like serine/threonine-protein kinase RLK1 [Acorus gramineus]|uniref:G-type lectin S-receptor-like serine/threonine-protein kinase RLK1 n=1 Tax=Acorus gramineus TaxID=55184 RepID=A0AAV9ATN4_ACOGR|nr:G-type lectin S-receptor-like serine/threonine-protein kinase RLK1 [Acorus gramineus]